MTQDPHVNPDPPMSIRCWGEGRREIGRSLHVKFQLLNSLLATVNHTKSSTYICGWSECPKELGIGADIDLIH